MIRKKTLILTYFFMVAISLSSIAGDGGRGPIFLDDIDQVAQAEKLFSEVVSFKRKVDQCLVSGIARRQSCNCLYPARLDSVRRVLGHSLATYPHWDEKTILWWASGSGEPLNIQLGRVILWTENVCADLAFSNP
tara:strand:- start:689 stop:1093 length:405 start_codon:yes stop_codon:yes gene_type:complete